MYYKISKMFKIFQIITIFAVATYGAKINQLRDDCYGYVEDGAADCGYVVQQDYMCPKNAHGNICDEDCKTLLACSLSTDSSAPLFYNKCSDLSSTAPYCIPGKSGCSVAGNSSDPKCLIVEKRLFPCTNVGYFPDPSNCTLYHVCTDEPEETLQYQCPPRYVFDAKTLKCKRWRGARDCSTINCESSANKYVVHPSNKAFYAFCGATETTMFRCEDEDNYEFNPTTVNCEFVCKAKGFYPDYTDSQKYYECYRGSGSRFLMQHQTCPKTMIFNAYIGRCIKGRKFSPYLVSSIE